MIKSAVILADQNLPTLVNQLFASGVQYVNSEFIYIRLSGSPGQEARSVPAVLILYTEGSGGSTEPLDPNRAHENNQIVTPAMEAYLKSLQGKNGNT